MKRSITAFTVLIIFIVTTVYAQQKTKIINFEKYYTIIKKKLPEIEKTTLEKEYLNYELEEIKRTYYPTLSLGSKYIIEAETVPSESDSNTVSSYASISKEFIGTGTQVTGGLQYNYQKEIKNSSVNNYYSPEIYLTVKQPLLKNFFGTLSKNNIKSAEILKEINELSLKEYLNEIEVYYKKLYYSWIVYIQLEEYYSINVKNAQSLYSQTLRKRKAGLAENDSVQAVYSSLLNYQQQLNNIHRSLNIIKNEIQTVTGEDEYFPEVADLNIIYERADNYDYKIVFFNDTLSYKIMKKNFENLDISLSSSKNSSYPELNALASVSASNQTEVESNKYIFENKEYYIGFELNYNFDNPMNSIAYKKSENSLKQYREIIKITSIKYELSLDDLILNIKSTQEVIKLKESNLKALRSQLLTEKRKYTQARLTVSNVISTENKIASEQASLLEKKYYLITLYFDYLNLVK